MSELKRGSGKCPKDKTKLHYKQACGMTVYREIVPPKPKRPYYVYDTRCPTCHEQYEIKK